MRMRQQLFCVIGQLCGPHTKAPDSSPCQGLFFYGLSFSGRHRHLALTLFISSTISPPRNRTSEIAPHAAMSETFWELLEVERHERGEIIGMFVGGR